MYLYGHIGNKQYLSISLDKLYINLYGSCGLTPASNTVDRTNSIISSQSPLYWLELWRKISPFHDCSAARGPCTCCQDVGIVVQRSLISLCSTVHAYWLLPSISLCVCVCVCAILLYILASDKPPMKQSKSDVRY